MDVKIWYTKVFKSACMRKLIVIDILRYLHVTVLFLVLSLEIFCVSKCR